ncbi:hypothetical protein CJ255_21460 [Candidatus Viridilinea mediisalina]|uniref:Nitrile hydratase alpha/Thiocyanate hydrolase gamma domain-containing protein n=2 Tax=Candidatus Viridilinea mediisalina TaxID=2024553 RepID=A0A2A6RDM7_9CHLR|nr:hypothetical protein CJ255_21460 [Candidatus Viridilinea mediisalina]
MASIGLAAWFSLTTEVQAQAQRDPAFRQELLRDPKTALQQSYGTEVPDFVALQALEETPTQRYLVLPFRSRINADELRDTELEAVAAGGRSSGGCPPASPCMRGDGGSGRNAAVLRCH